MGDELPPLLLLALFDESVDRVSGLNSGNVGMHSLADREEIDGQQTAEHRKQGADLEVNQRLNACDANLFQIGDTGDAPNDVRNTIGPMSIFIAAMKVVPIGSMAVAHARPQPADQDTDDDREEDPEIELPVEGEYSGEWSSPLDVVVVIAVRIPVVQPGDNGRSHLRGRGCRGGATDVPGEIAGTGGGRDGPLQPVTLLDQAEVFQHQRAAGHRADRVADALAAMSGAEPCTGSNMLGKRRSGL